MLFRSRERVRQVELGRVRFVFEHRDSTRELELAVEIAPRHVRLQDLQRVDQPLDLDFSFDAVWSKTGKRTQPIALDAHSLGQRERDVESWQQSPLRDRFDAVVFSYQLGVRKPDARIYERALEAIGVAPGDAIFVGDGGSDEHRGARALGMTTVLVTRLYALWWPDEVAARRGRADWEFEDVPAFVAALGL